MARSAKGARLVGGAIAMIASLTFATAGASAATTLKVWSMFRLDQVGWDKAFKVYEKAHPGLKIQYTSVPWGPEKFLTAAAGGAAPDVTIIGDDFLQVYTDKKLISPAPRAVQQELDSKFFPAAIRMCKRQGITYGMPVELSFMAFQYNRNLFKEVGLPPAAPETWNELALYAKKLTVWDGAKMKRAGFNLFLNGGQNEIFPVFQTLLAANGAPAIPDDLSSTTLTSNALSRETMQYMVDLARTHQVDAVGAPDPWGAFPAGKLPMWIEGTWTTSRANIKSQAVFDAIDMAPIPRGKGANASYGWGWVGCVSKQSKKQAQSWDFVQFLTNEENSRIYADLLGTAIPRKGVDSALKDHLRPRYPVIAATVETRSVYNRYYGDLRTLAGSLIWKAMAGKISPSDALDQLEKQIKVYGARKK